MKKNNDNYKLISIIGLLRLFRFKDFAFLILAIEIQASFGDVSIQVFLHALVCNFFGRGLKLLLMDDFMLFLVEAASKGRNPTFMIVFQRLISFSTKVRLFRVVLNHDFSLMNFLI